MDSTNKKIIEDYYRSKSFSILAVPTEHSHYLAFEYIDFLSLLKFFRFGNIIISSIELYEKGTYEFVPPNFWYHWESMEECFSLIEDFLWKLNDCNGHYYTIWIDTNNPQSMELKVSLDKIAIDKAPLKRK